MSYIKELWDMYTKIREGISDSATRELLVPLKERIVDVEREQIRLENAVSTAKQQQEETIAELHAMYGQKIAALQHENAEREQFVESHGTYFKKNKDSICLPINSTNSCPKSKPRMTQKLLKNDLPIW